VRGERKIEKRPGPDVMVGIRIRIRTLARHWMTVGEITSLLDRGLTEVEREIVWRIALEETRLIQGRQGAPWWTPAAVHESRLPAA
jgi:hypothetical protein